jgi:acetyl-CoA C-acetyltransferase
MKEAFIIDAVRLAGGKRKGRLAGIHAVDLGALSLNALLQRTSFDPAAVDDVIWGCVTEAGEQSQHVGRNCVLASNLPRSVPAVTIDRQCGSSQQAVQFAAQAVLSGTQDLVIAGGVESMTRVPMNSAVNGASPLSPAEQTKLGVPTVSQFVGAQMIAEKWGFDRETLDRFALESHRRAFAAQDANAFADEIVPVRVTLPDGSSVVQAFASVPLAWLKHLGADPAKLNVNGGAIALGHPLGATGGKLMATLVHTLRKRKRKYGLQTMCEGGGVANVTILEAL